MKPLRHSFAILLTTLIFSGCKNEPTTLFRLLPSDETGITFMNQILENDTFNILTHEYIYNGGGVGVADFNNDGLQDLFFSGNVVPNKLYLNKGNLKFQDVTEKANVNTNNRWNSGVAIADVNSDGLMDIYVCATMLPDSANRKNSLFINQGIGADGAPTFINKAAEYGVEDGGYSVNAAFLDYDKDGDLDLYVLINQRMENLPTNYRAKISDGSAINNDNLYRNNNDGTFTNVTQEAGITLEGFGLGLSVSDFNNDGWTDIYVSNDYLSNDVLYINNKNGTFSNKTSQFISHQSQFSMGNDAADINNDSRLDIITVDMLPETNDRKKTTIGNKSYLTYINNEKFHYEYQYVRNMLHVNNGVDAGIKFSEIGELAGIYQTEWSWAPLFADFDNDGNKDLIITNGFPKDITDKDFANYRSLVGNIASIGLLEDSIPIVKIPNYAFKNNGDLTFKNVSKEWGMDVPSFSNGASFVDLDNDGDLDYIVNNINAEASVYENTLNTEAKKKENKNSNAARIKLSGPKGRNSVVGAKVKLFAEGKMQYYENNIYRGFLSSVEGIVHFGLGSTSKVDSLIIEWPDGKSQKVDNIKLNELVTIDYQPTSDKSLISHPAAKQVLFENATASSGIIYKHEEEDKIDFNVQRTLPHKFTQSGPGLATGDVNGDGLEDLIIGGSANYSFSTFIQGKNGKFSRQRESGRDENKKQEDEGLLLFDADNDSDLDLYIVSGSIENYNSNDPYQDRLYKNDGRGKFTLDAIALPDTKTSGSCVRAADFDRDGDLDLFVAGRVVPGKYPFSPESYLLRNDKGKFTDITLEACEELRKPGMISDAIWSDFNNDGKVDLILAGEFTPVMFFQNNGEKFSRVKTSVDKNTGWWSSITAGDFDKDGDTDYVVGNLGWNNNYQMSSECPLRVYAKDFDNNNSIDAIMACYARVSMNSPEKKLYPIHFWDELNTQSPKFRNKYSRYRQYSKATIDQVLSPDDLKDALVLEATNMSSSYFQNVGNGEFKIDTLPTTAQFAPVRGMIADDVNGDGNLDVVLTGNDYGNEVFAGRYDAMTGTVLAGDGKGKFNVLGSASTGFYVPADAKALIKLHTNSNTLFVASQNRDSLKVFSSKIAQQTFLPKPGDQWAEFLFSDGRKQRVEFYYGAGYLSQSTRSVTIPKGAAEIVVYDSKGNSRKESFVNQ
jgi:hypothetical protein